MDFEAMKIIWDSQNEEPLFAVNQAGLQTVLDAKSKEFKRFVFWQEAQSYLSCGLVVMLCSIALIGYYTGILERIKGIEMTRWDAAALYVGIACWILFALRVFLGRAHQRAKERKQTESILQTLEKDLDKVQFEINVRGLKTLIVGFIPPHIGGILFTWVVFKATGLPPWAIIPFVCVMLGGFIFETNMQRGLVKDKLQPRKQELESLRDKLLKSHA